MGGNIRCHSQWVAVLLQCFMLPPSGVFCTMTYTRCIGLAHFPLHYFTCMHEFCGTEFAVDQRKSRLEKPLRVAATQQFYEGERRIYYNFVVFFFFFINLCYISQYQKFLLSPDPRNHYWTLRTRNATEFPTNVVFKTQFLSLQVEHKTSLITLTDDLHWRKAGAQLLSVLGQHEL